MMLALEAGQLPVSDVDKALAFYTEVDFAVGPIGHRDSADWAGGYTDGIDPDHRDYASFAGPDGNTWTLQERGFASRKGH